MLPLYLFSKDWFGLHPNEEEIIVDRSAIDGVALIDSVWDISELEIIDTGIEYKVKRTGENKFTLREGGHRHYFTIDGETLLWNGTETRMWKTIGEGIVVGKNRESNSWWSFGTFDGVYCQNTPFRVVLEIEVKKMNGALVYGSQKLTGLKMILFEKKTINPEIMTSAALIEEYAYLFSDSIALPLMEAQRMYWDGYSPIGWDMFYAQSSFLEALDLENVEFQDNNPNKTRLINSISSSSEKAFLEIFVDQNDEVVELILCSISGIVYWTYNEQGVNMGFHRYEIPLNGVPVGNALVIVKVGDQTHKTLIYIP